MPRVCRHNLRRGFSKPTADRSLSRDELAAELDLHPDSIKRHHKREPAPPHDRRAGKCFYNAAEYAAWMKANKLDGGPGRPSDVESSPDLEAAKLRKENALASKYELDVRRMKGRLVPLDEVKRAGIALLTAARNRLVGLPAQVTPLLEGRDNAERQTILEQQISDTLYGLASDIERLGVGNEAA